MFAFDGARGDRLAGRLDVPDGTPRAVALLAHCLGGGNEGPAAAAFARCFTEQGMAVLSVDCAALGAGDLAAAAAQLRAAIAAPAILVGHSLAGPAILAAAGRIPEARAVVTVGAPAGDADRTAALHRPLLIIHVPDDLVVSVEAARVIFEAARHPKSFVSLDGADHRLTRPADAAYAASVIAAWAARYLPAPAGPDRGTGLAAPADSDVVVVTESQARPYGQRITVGRHELTADEPGAVGGADSGPSPYELLLAGLGACTAITVRMYADRKGWPLRHVAVRLRHERIHARDCAECETGTGQLDHIERKIQFDGDLTGEQRTRLLDMAGRCPVHRTLHSEVHVSTTEASLPRSIRIRQFVAKSVWRARTLVIRSYRPNYEARRHPRREVRETHHHRRSEQGRVERPDLSRRPMPVRLRKGADAGAWLGCLGRRAVMRMFARAAEIWMEAVPGLREACPDPAGPPDLLTRVRLQASRRRIAVAKPVI